MSRDTGPDPDAPFRVELTGGHSIVARRILVATGLVDELPDVPGLAAHWGGDVLHCPFCHGYEVRDRRVVHIVTRPSDLHATEPWRHLTTRLTVVVAPRSAPRIEVFGDLSLETVPHPSGLGDVVATDATGATSVTGVYAAGSVTDPGQPVAGASASGSWVGATISFSLAHEDLLAAAWPSAHARDWDHRYEGGPMWSGNPNGSLVKEVSGLNPGRALDVGAGEGGDALWLAEQGWRVTASDISERGLDRVRTEAARRGLDVECLRADANAAEPFEVGAYDLVSAHYASIPRTPDARGVHNLIGAVAPGGVLLIVTHDPEAMATPVDPRSHSRPFDPDAYVGTDSFAEAVSGAGGWEIEHHERRPRPHGAVSTHHVHDVVFRARRQAAPAA